ncbi:tRNA preQ1(34) S-adenosylmethionine ribosyltransferase-isomerase QueA [Steroidobacter sp.]|uniref:tRNA preQ1(34) S-adenosylmethionine ribosyltransferase-isomerase QueA n=1 Tax=Steroidobacter sp. TaxID=1978227 RepID=UPI001A3902FE|nr:tRNA preQ1(34) S-adenosylmethionine ribosyltransferase-isomerase QueA [Steroidobacter sp.]MBL8268907.1 tRNA preQ1(34) S-adenosylmethionine ribosyltransferase-isomerase QueA [Steroidobacter sp.]
MRRSDFAYDLPVDLIAQHPPRERAGGRLLHVALAAPLQDLKFTDLPDLLNPGDLLVFNDTRVIPARVHGVKPTGGQVEVLLERVLEGNRILAHVKAGKPLRPDAPVALTGGAEARFIARHEDLFELQLNVEPLAYFEQYGAMPLPPYIDRGAEADDADRYQTIYAREPGAVAAPTAGLHFDDQVLARCKAKGIDSTFVTLHVGAGTFQNIRVDDLQQHRMHAERISVSADACAAIAATKTRGGRVVAVGTTVVRSLESAAQLETLQPYEGETRLFITPGYQFRVIDALVTNFHLPESTLLMLVCAFGGFDQVIDAYKHAVAQRYRFFSYGDAMFLERR